MQWRLQDLCALIDVLCPSWPPKCESRSSGSRTSRMRQVWSFWCRVCSLPETVAVASMPQPHSRRWFIWCAPWSIRTKQIVPSFCATSSRPLASFPTPLPQSSISTCQNSGRRIFRKATGRGGKIVRGNHGSVSNLVYTPHTLQGFSGTISTSVAGNSQVGSNAQSSHVRLGTAKWYFCGTSTHIHPPKHMSNCQTVKPRFR